MARIWDALTPNPETGQSIWYAEIVGDGYRHEFTMLRFALDKLYDSIALYPAPMQGSIKILPRKDKAVQQVQQSSQELAQPPASTVQSKPVEPLSAAPVHQAVSAGAIPVVSAPAEPKTAPEIRPPVVEAKKKKSPPRQTPMIDMDVDDRVLRHAVQDEEPDDGLLAEEESATYEAGEARRERVGTVVPHVAAPPLLPGIAPASGEREPSEAAIRFMNWLQQGIADGTLAYNVSGALVHFIQEGMLLVSPKIFREFATQLGEDGAGAPPENESKLGTGIQRQVALAGWNAVGPGKSNIFKVSILKKGGEAVAQLSVMIILQPDRWISPIPAANPHIVLTHKKAAPA